MLCWYAGQRFSRILHHSFQKVGIFIAELAAGPKNICQILRLQCAPLDEEDSKQKALAGPTSNGNQYEVCDLCEKL